jgi:hypothetical protein
LLITFVSACAETKESKRILRGSKPDRKSVDIEPLVGDSQRVDDEFISDIPFDEDNNIFQLNPLPRQTGLPLRISWSSPPIAQEYIAGLHAKKDCQDPPAESVIVNTNEWIIDKVDVGEYYVCVAAVTAGDFYLSANNQGIPIQIRRDWSPLTGAPSFRIDSLITANDRYMIIWGGYLLESTTQRVYSGEGAVFDFFTQKWTPTSFDKAPSARSSAISVWTNSELFVWGGESRQPSSPTEGAFFDPQSNSWRTVSSVNAPTEVSGAVWTGTHVLTFGPARNSMAMLDPLSLRWQPVVTSQDPLIPRQYSQLQSAWTGSELLIWASTSTTELNIETIASRFSPINGEWRSLPLQMMPSPRIQASATWTGSEFVILGGISSLLPQLSFANLGGKLDSTTSLWQPLTSGAGLTQVASHGAVWNGREILVWGGQHDNEMRRRNIYSYDPILGNWQDLGTQTESPSPRIEAKTFWLNGALVVWGGRGLIDNQEQALWDGGIYFPQ